MLNWVSAKERMPEKSGDYLCALLDNAEGVTDIGVESFNAEEGIWTIPSYQILTFWAEYNEPPLLTKAELLALVPEPICELTEGMDYAADP